MQAARLTEKGVVFDLAVAEVDAEDACEGVCIALDAGVRENATWGVSADTSALEDGRLAED